MEIIETIPFQRPSPYHRGLWTSQRRSSVRRGEHAVRRVTSSVQLGPVVSCHGYVPRRDFGIVTLATQLLTSCYFASSVSMDHGIDHAARGADTCSIEQPLWISLHRTFLLGFC